MALLWGAAATAAARRLPLSRPSAVTTIHGRRSSTSSSSGTKTTTPSQLERLADVLLRIGLWFGVAAYTAIKVTEKDFASIREDMQKKADEKEISRIREELQKKADEKEISRIREELQRLQTSNAVLSRCFIDLQDERSRLKHQLQAMTAADIAVQDPAPPAPSLPCIHGLAGEETGRGGGYWEGSWAQLQKDSARPAENQQN